MVGAVLLLDVSDGRLGRPGTGGRLLGAGARSLLLLLFVPRLGSGGRLLGAALDDGKLGTPGSGALLLLPLLKLGSGVGLLGAGVLKLGAEFA